MPLHQLLSADLQSVRGRDPESIVPHLVAAIHERQLLEIA